MYLQLKNISKQFQNNIILNDVNVAIAQNTTISILGKSGCGKSTLLKIIAGIEPANSGKVLLNDVDITDVKISDRNIVYLFQEPLLFPHLNVFDNIAFGLKIKKESTAIINEKVTLLLKQLELEAEATKMPHQISGGQKQRVAFGRALIINPPLMLLDEPFSSLDNETRAAMQKLYKSVATAYNITTLFVTHDLKECLIMGDTIAYMENGQLTMYATKNDFINELKTGVVEEINFWNNL